MVDSVRHVMCIPATLLMNCSASGLVYLSAGLVYSSPDGRITASTLIHRIQTNLFSQDNPSILVNGTPVPLSKQCIPQLNERTQRACVPLLISAFTQGKETTECSGVVIGSFFGGFAAGVLIISLLITIIIMFVATHICVFL